MFSRYIFYYIHSPVLVIHGYRPTLKSCNIEVSISAIAPSSYSYPQYKVSSIHVKLELFDSIMVIVVIVVGYINTYQQQQRRRSGSMVWILISRNMHG